MASFEPDGPPTLMFSQWLNHFRAGTIEWDQPSTECIWKVTELYDKYIPLHCLVCKRSEGHGCGALLTCSGCSIVRYCSIEHQKIGHSHHMFRHKAFCRFVKSFIGGEFGPPPSKPTDTASWREFVLSGASAIRNHLGHRINQNEIFGHQPHCCVCFESPLFPSTTLPHEPESYSAPSSSSSKKQKKFQECAVCRSSQHCSKPACEEAFARKHTPGACEYYAIHVGCQHMCNAMGGEPPNNISLLRSDKCSPPCTRLPRSWGDYFSPSMRGMAGIESLPAALTAMPPVMAMVTDTLTLQHTILMALEDVYGKERLFSMTKITLHLLGSTITERLIKFEELFHWLPNLRDLDMSLVGPLLPSSPLDPAVNTVTSELNEYPLCSACLSLGCCVHRMGIRTLYHDKRAQELAPVRCATLVVAQHSGVSEFAGKVTFDATWRATVDLILNAEVPALFTCYNLQEAIEDEQCLSDMGARVVRPYRRNPLRGLRPFLEVTEDNTFFFSNDHDFVVQGRVTYSVG